MTRRGRRWLIRVAVVILLLPLFTLLMIVTHETGHTMIAWLLGDHRAIFVLYRQSGADTCMGCNLYDSQSLSAWGNLGVNLGGVLFTALLSVAAVLAVAWRRPRWMSRWALTELVAICYFGDLLWQVIQAVLTWPPPNREPVGWGTDYTDFRAAVSFGSQATGWAHDLSAGIGVLCATLYTLALLLLFLWAWRRSSSSDRSLSNIRNRDDRRTSA